MRVSVSSVLQTLFLGLAFNRVSVAALSDDLLRIAGTHVIYSYAGLAVPEQLLDLIRQGQVGGVILFADNISNQTSTSAAIELLQDANKQSPDYHGLPLLIMTDQEGGEVRRVKFNGGGPTLSAKQMGAAADPANASYTGGMQVDTTLLPAGINHNLAPVLDVYRQAGDFEDFFQRSFGNTSALVSQCIGPFITAMQDGGVVGTAKHFPGLGAASHQQDTDVGPVTLNLTLKELRSVDEAPYQTAIQAGVKMVMTSWAVYPALDADYPSGLSPKWVQGELRQRLGFEGVTITDALEAGALAAYGDVPNRAYLAAKAGMDLILCSQGNVTQGLVATQTLAKALSCGKLNRAEFDTATQRIKDVRRWLVSE